MKRCILPALLALASVLPAGAESTGAATANITLTVGANPAPGNVPVTATVQPGGDSTKIPTGTITFLDGTTVLNPGGTALTAPGGIKGQTFAAAVGALDPTLASVAKGMVTGDFDGDGKPDLLVYGSASSDTSTLVQVFLTSNAGSAPFRIAAMQTVAAPLAVPPAALDVNGDGKLDLLIGNMAADGNGDGTFQTAAAVPFLASGFQQTYAVNVTGGNGADIVAVNAPPSPIPNNATVQFSFTVFKNEGSGTFTSLGSFPLAAPIQTGDMTLSGLNIFSLSFGDVNGDGKLDVLSQSNSVAFGNGANGVNFNVMLNNGDGTFGAPKALDASAFLTLGGSAVAFGDVNGDGKADLVATYAENTGQNFMAAALGNGDGTFGSFFTLQLINFLTAAIPNPQVQLADVNGDGIPDVVAGSGEVALGKGDGTFALATPLFVQPVAQLQTPLNYALVQLPMESGAAQSLVYLNTASGANAVFTPQNAATVQATLALAAGTHALTAMYSGDGTYASAQAGETVAVAAVTPSITLTSSASTIYATQPVTFTASLTPAITGTITFLDAYPGSNPLQPILDPTPTTLGTATIANGVASLTVNQLPAGVHTITAVYGDVTAPTAQAQMQQTVNLPFAFNNGTGAIALTVASGQTGSTTFTLQPLGGFSGPVQLRCGMPTCTLSPASVTLSGTSPVTVTMTVSATTAPSTSASLSPLQGMTLACGVPLFALLGFTSAGRRRVLFLVVALAFCVAPFSGCGGGSSSSTPSNGLKAGVYPFYVFATAGQNELAQNAILTVQ